VADACVDRFVFVSHGNLRSHVKFTARRGARSVVVPNGVDAQIGGAGSSGRRKSLREELGLPIEATICVAVGQLEERKGILDYVRAARVASAIAPSLLFVVIGDGPLRKQAEDLAAEYGLSGSLRFLGHQADVPRLLPAFDIYVQPSLFEGLSIAMLEALAAGLPMATTDVDGVTEVFPDGSDMLRVPVGDVDALAEAIIRLANDEELRRKLGRAAGRRIRAGFTTSVMCSSYARVYQELETEGRMRHSRVFPGRLGRLPRSSR
jgi:glycosyltransferase involved in cell wall biosynthesis